MYIVYIRRHLYTCGPNNKNHLGIYDFVKPNVNKPTLIN